MNDYPEACCAERDSKKSLAKRIAEINPVLEISVRADSYHGGGGDKSWMKERHARLKKEVDLLDGELADWDPAAVAERVKKSIKSELAIRRAELLKCEAEMDNAGVDYEGAEGAEEKEEEEPEEKTGKPKRRAPSVSDMLAAEDDEDEDEE
jgi:hypothetical protein